MQKGEWKRVENSAGYQCASIFSLLLSAFLFTLSIAGGLLQRLNYPYLPKS